MFCPSTDSLAGFKLPNLQTFTREYVSEVNWVIKTDKAVDLDSPGSAQNFLNKSLSYETSSLCSSRCGVRLAPVNWQVRGRRARAATQDRARDGASPASSLGSCYISWELEPTACFEWLDIEPNYTICLQEMI